ncbi:SpaA isopeptide-forming pilin-related protein [Lactiplantibacillus nangangensis]
MRKKSRIAHFLMALLLMLQVLVIPIGALSADTVPAASSVGGGVELFSTKQGSDKPTEKLSISEYSGDYKVTAKLNNQTHESFDGGKIRIRLDRRDFDQPTAEGLAKPADNDFADKLEGGTVITTDPKDWIIEYSLKQVSAGENLEIPSVVQPMRLNVDQTRGTIVEEILDQHDQVVSTANTGYYIDSSPLVDRGFGMSQSTGDHTALNYYYNYQDKENQLKPNGDGSYTTLSDGTTNMYISYLYGTNDSRNIDVTMDLSKLDVLTFNADAPNGWHYDATTKKATRRFTPSEFTGDRPQRYLPLKVPKGSQLTFNVNDEYKERIYYEVRYEGSTAQINSEHYTWPVALALKSGQNWDPVPEGNGVHNETNLSHADLADVNAQTKLRYSVQTAGQIAGGGFQHIPAGVELPVSKLKATLPTDFYQDNNLQGFALKVANTPSLPGMTDNHLYGINADGSKELLKDNLGVTPWDATKLTKKYQGFQLEFDHPIMVTNKDAAFGFNIITTMSEQPLDAFRKDPSKKVKYYQLDKVFAQYPGYYKDAFAQSWFSSFYLNKYKQGDGQPAEISTGDRDDQVNVVNGHDFTINRSFSLQGNYANTQLENGKVYFIVPEHMRLAADQSGLKGLAKPQIIPNFHNSGRTAIVADLLPVNSSENGYTRYDISLPLDAAQLRQGDNYQIEGYVVYNNNDGSYDLNNPAGASSIVTPTLTGGDKYQLYADTKDPSKGLKLANTTLNYMPIAGLKVSNLVAKGDGGYSSDLGAYGYAGDVIKYRTNLYNGYSEVAKNIGLVDYLPVAGANGSKFDVKLAGPVTITNKTATTASPIDYAKAFKVYYATAKPSYGADDYSNSVVWRTASQLAPTDYPKVTMVKMALDSNVPFDPKAEVDFDYPAQMTTAETPDQSQAINQVQLINASGTYYNVNQAKVTMNYPVNAVQTTKIDSVSQKPLYGARFRLLDSTGQAIGTQLYETNATGKFQISDLKAGKYYLEEVVAPDGYVLPQGEAAKTAFTIGTTANTPTTVKITNVSKESPQGNVLIKNQDNDTGQPLNGSRFSLSRVTAIGETSVDDNLVITANGQLNHSGLLLGKYRLRQKTAPNGYLLNSQAFDFTISAGETSNVLVKNSAIPVPVKGQLTIINHEKGQSSKPVEGSEFELIDQSTGEQVGGKLVTDKNGQIVKTDLPAGDYQVKQVSVPTGYLLNAETQTVKISKDTPKVTAEFTNDLEPVKGQLTIINHEKNQPTKLIAGSKFELIDQQTGKQVGDKLVTDNNGQIVKKDLPAGDYQIKQVSVTDGYILNPNSQTVKISKENSTVTAKFVNDLKPVKGQLTIINHETDQPTKLIGGSEFELIDQQTGKQVGDKLVTDKNGQIVKKDLPAGDYQINQVSVPDGYALNPNSQTVKISKENSTVTAKFVNDLKPVTPEPVKGQLTIINHEKGQPSKLIAGSKFELVDQSTGQQVAENLVTDKNGQIVQSNLPVGDYQLNQVSVPVGYVLNTETQAVKISKETPKVTMEFTNDVKPETPEPIKGQLTIINHETNQPTKLIANSEFELIDQSTGKQVGNKLVTDKDGQVVQSNLPAGDYQLKQVSVPAGYVLNTKTQTVTISKDTPNVTVKFENEAKPVTPEPIKGQLTIINHEKNHSSKLIAGSEFSLLDQSTGKQVGDKLVTDKDGQIVQSNLPAGDYKLKQVSVPAGYVLNTETQTVTISKDTPVVTAKFENEAKPVTPEPVKGQLTIINHEKNHSSKLIAGSEFSLLDQSTGKQVGDKLVTDKDGQIVQSNLPAGDYQLKQVAVPTGYVLNTETQTITISKNTPKVTAKFENEAKPVTPVPVKGQLTIVNHEKGQPSKLIAGSEFNLFDQKTGKQVGSKLVTDKNGQIVQSNLPAGDYQLKQVAVPTGYVLNTKTQTVTISKDNPQVTAKFENEAKSVTPVPIKGQLTIINHEKNHSNKLIAGSEFKLINSETGKQVAGKLVTDKDGRIVQKDLAAGAYQLKQVSVPAGYVLNTETQIVQISKDSPTTAEFENEAKSVTPVPIKGQLTIINHVKNQPTKLISGSEFVLIDQSTGKQIFGKLTTDKNGQIVQKALPVGAYRIKQVSVSSGYLLNSETQFIKVSEATPTVNIKFVNDVKPTVSKPDVAKPQQPTTKPNTESSSAADAIQSTKPTASSKSKGIASSKAKSAAATSKSKTKNLPQSNEQLSIGLITLGVLLLVLVLAYAWKKAKVSKH